MNPQVEQILARVRAAEEDLAREFDAQQTRWRYRVERGRVRFEDEARLAHKRLKQGLIAFFRESGLLNALTAPIIYSMIVPLLMLDLWVTVYQWTCFPIYGIPRVSRRKYLVIDRHKLGYLNIIEKGNCVFCGYGNGLLAYVREVSGRTEQYWCPIKHARRVTGPHSRYHLFVDYGDAEGYRHDLPLLRHEFGPQSGRNGEPPAAANDKP
jgi:hypothetical protein